MSWPTGALVRYWAYSPPNSASLEKAVDARQKVLAKSIAVPVADIRIIHCTASTSAIQDRTIRRAEINPHRRAHNDRELIADITAGSHSVERFESVDLDVPALTVDTTDGYCPDFEAIARFVKLPR
jgi:hypothetical protein